jgi:deoxyribodipyrimidine photo-lyase
LIQKERIKILNKNPKRNNKFVVYWMQASQRAEYNHALEYAIVQANNLNKPLIVFFGLTDDYPEANERHYAFMLQGLHEVDEVFRNRGIKMAVIRQSPELAIVELSKVASLIVVDRGYSRIQQKWRRIAAEKVNCLLVQIESDVIVPVEQASWKEEYSAATLRPKIKKKINHYLLPLDQNTPKKDSLHIVFDSLEIDNIDHVLADLKIDHNVKRVQNFIGGTSHAKKLLQYFIDKKLAHYSNSRNDPAANGISHMSPYLHFGQISPLYIALKILEKKSPESDAYLEELVVRRELSMNFVFYNPYYDQFSSLPEWCKKTLKKHEKDQREYSYSRKELEKAQTHDPYWNAAQKEMVSIGKMHGYMRMYWGKKIIEWTQKPEDAFRRALYLNNKYELDGRDPNGFAGVAWCFGKHDRAWPERPIFGKVRYMNANGLRRKFDMDTYVEKIEAIPYKNSNI